MAHSDTLSGSNTRASVKDYYGRILGSTKDLKTSACTASGRPSPTILSALKRVPEAVKDKFYGCGAPLPLGIKDLRVLDLGCGSGRDCYVASALVGESGSVTGLDMTAEQLEVAIAYADEYSKTLGYKKSNMRFLTGHIEYLDQAGIADGSVDLIISNCVINLSPDKEQVLREAYRVLAAGGEMYFSDVYSDRRVPEEAKKNEVLWGECISGALYTGDFMSMAKAAGFADPRLVSSSPISVTDPSLLELLGNASFFSKTFRLFKLPGLLEPACEDYGQYAIYKGTIEGHAHSYQLDRAHTFEKGKPSLVCGNTAGMLGEDGLSWLASHFKVSGDRSVHFGEYECTTKDVKPETSMSGCC